ncbi:MAG: phosphodiester glycosidase family protein, partial [Clostridia bacterium]|nr:phosphodiester glycosidase family protein [Clostridia bacterium]
GSTGAMAKEVPGCMLAINASGYVSPTYSWVPENYPGTNEDYFYTPLGSVTVTHGRVYRYLRDVPYYGLTLEEDGLHLCNGEKAYDVISRNVQETWSFYEQCPLILDGISLLPEDWPFAHAKASRNIICKIGEGRYFVLIITSHHGLTLFDCVSYLLREIEPLWAYNLDGGPSTGLYCRTDPNGEWTAIYPNRQQNVDIMAFTE